MGLFKFIKKAVGGVVKAGLGIVTHGASDKVFAALKSRGEQKRVAANQAYNLQQLALAEKTRPLHPRTIRTEQLLDESTAPYVPQPTKAQIYGRTGYSYSRAKEFLARGPVNDPTIPEESRPARKPRRKRQEPSNGGGDTFVRPRGVAGGPRGGLDLKKISQMWNAEGRPGRWLDYIKAHTNVRKT